MNERVRTHLTEYCKKKGWDTDEATLVDVVREGKFLHEETIKTRRH